MTARVMYVMGPSGAGKDSLLAWLKDRLPPDTGVRFARRTITRAVQAGGEQHRSVDLATFLRLRDAASFGLDWHANGLHYGIAHGELPPQPNGASVIVNGSRAYLAQALTHFPNMAVVHVNASLELLRQRLAARGREDGAAVEARVARAAAFQFPEGLNCIEIHNNGRLSEAGEQLLQVVQRWATQR